VVHVGADVRRLPRPRPGGRRHLLLPVPALDAGRERNRFRLQRLKDKLGNRSNASSEVEFDSAAAWLVGEEGAGVRTIIEMVNHTRLDCVMGGATGMRAGSPRRYTTPPIARSSVGS